MSAIAAGGQENDNVGLAPLTGVNGGELEVATIQVLRSDLPQSREVRAQVRPGRGGAFEDALVAGPRDGPVGAGGETGGGGATAIAPLGPLARTALGALLALGPRLAPQAVGKEVLVGGPAVQEQSALELVPRNDPDRKPTLQEGVQGAHKVHRDGSLGEIGVPGMQRGGDVQGRIVDQEIAVLVPVVPSRVQFLQELVELLRVSVGELREAESAGAIPGEDVAPGEQIVRRQGPNRVHDARGHDVSVEGPVGPGEELRVHAVAHRQGRGGLGLADQGELQSLEDADTEAAVDSQGGQHGGRQLVWIPDQDQVSATPHNVHYGHHGLELGRLGGLVDDQERHLRSCLSRQDLRGLVGADDHAGVSNQAVLEPREVGAVATGVGQRAGRPTEVTIRGEVFQGSVDLVDARQANKSPGKVRVLVELLLAVRRIQGKSRLVRGGVGAGRQDDGLSVTQAAGPGVEGALGKGGLARARGPVDQGDVVGHRSEKGLGGVPVEPVPLHAAIQGRGAGSRARTLEDGAQALVDGVVREGRSGRTLGSRRIGAPGGTSVFQVAVRDRAPERGRSPGAQIVSRSSGALGIVRCLLVGAGGSAEGQEVRNGGKGQPVQVGGVLVQVVNLLHRPGDPPVLDVGRGPVHAVPRNAGVPGTGSNRVVGVEGAVLGRVVEDQALIGREARALRQPQRLARLRWDTAAQDRGPPLGDLGELVDPGARDREDEPVIGGLRALLVADPEVAGPFQEEELFALPNRQRVADPEAVQGCPGQTVVGRGEAHAEGARARAAKRESGFVGPVVDDLQRGAGLDPGHAPQEEAALAQRHGPERRQDDGARKVPEGHRGAGASLAQAAGSTVQVANGDGRGQRRGVQDLTSRRLQRLATRSGHQGQGGSIALEVLRNGVQGRGALDQGCVPVRSAPETAVQGVLHTEGCWPDGRGVQGCATRD